jgi:nicotinate phosphoribosyltransferase
MQTDMLQSILDNDFYKFTMQQGAFMLYPYAEARYSFINRGKHSFPAGFAAALQTAVDAMKNLCLTPAEKEFLRITCPYLTPVYLDFLEGYRYDPSEVTISQEGGDVKVEISGRWYRTILWEVPVMSLICELFYVMSGMSRISDQEVVEKTRQKAESYKQLGITIAEFGSRRRHSYDVHDLVMHSLTQYCGGTFIGSSNLHMAMRYQTKPIGTHAHEWFMYHAAQYGFKMANAIGLEHWTQVYRGDLGIALSDTYTTEVFFRQFDKMYSKLFDGVRHDSGDPLLFADKVIAHYTRMGISPASKTIIFSDGLDYEKVARIVDHCRGRIGMSFGIGTSLTNDVGPSPMNIVIKMTAARPENEHWTPVVKLSDEHGKHTGEETAIALAKAILEIDRDN